MGAAMAVLDMHGLNIQEAYRAEDQFLTQCLTAKKIGLWAAGLMGMEGAAAESYALDLVLGTLEPGEMDFVRKLQADFQARGIAVSDHRIVVTVAQQMEAAKRFVALRLWSLTSSGEVKWERRQHPRLALPPMTLPPTLQEWRKRHAQKM